MTLAATFVVSILVATIVSFTTVWLYLDYLRPWLVDNGVLRAC